MRVLKVVAVLMPRNTVISIYFSAKTMYRWHFKSPTQTG